MAERFQGAAAGGATIASLSAFRRDLLAAVEPVDPVHLAPDAALGAVLAEDLVAERPRPERPIALLGGFALASIETVGASPYGPVMPSRLVAVAAGAELPEGCDAVVAADAIVRDLGLPMVQDLVAPGTNVLRAGAEIEAGTRFAAAGERLGVIAAEVANLVGRETIAVRRPRLALHHDGSPARASAAALLARLVGRRATIVGPAATEDFGRLAADLHIAVGRGDRHAADPAVAALAERGWIGADGVAISPSDAVARGAFGRAPALVLPGRLDEIVATWLLVVEPLVERLAGAAPEAPSLPVRLARKIVSQVGFGEVAYLAPLASGGWDPVAVGRAWDPVAVGRASWAALARARAWIELTPESEGLAEGTEVLARPLGFDGALAHGDRT